MHLATNSYRHVFFFLMTRRPPRSPLFPSTTLFRSWPGSSRRSTSPSPRWPRAPTRGRRGPRRSEEHTSELESHEHLVCRLLVEKNYSGLSGNAVAGFAGSQGGLEEERGTQ